MKSCGFRFVCFFLCMAEEIIVWLDMRLNYSYFCDFYFVEWTSYLLLYDYDRSLGVTYTAALKLYSSTSHVTVLLCRVLINIHVWSTLTQNQVRDCFAQWWKPDLCPSFRWTCVCQPRWRASSPRELKTLAGSSLLAHTKWRTATTVSGGWRTRMKNNERTR